MRNLRLTPFNAIFVVRDFLIENLPQFEGFTMYDSQDADNFQIFHYTAIYRYNREVKLTVIVDYQSSKISANILLATQDLAAYM